jgi:hypothetical protein
MAVELGVHCRIHPDAQLTERLVSPVMSSILGSRLVGAWVDESADSWILNWGGATTAHVTLLPSGLHEFGDDWFATISPGERGADLSLVLAIVITTLIAIACDGHIVDDLSILGSEPPSAAHVLTRMLSCRERSAQEVLAAIEATGKLGSSG